MYDVLVIGGGPGGYAAAIRASQMGGKAALAEAAEIGGACVNRGCIPSKIWLGAADLLRSIREGDRFGIRATVDRVEPGAVVARKNGVAGDIRMGMEGLLSNNGIKVIRGRAVFKAPLQVEIEGALVEAKKIIIATGSRLEAPDIPGLDQAGLTTDQVLDMTAIPSSVLVCGSGPVEMEMAALLKGFGSRVVIASESRRLLPLEDEDTGQRLARAMREQGVEVISRVTLKSVQKTEAGCACLLSGAEEKTVEVERVLVSSRKPNTDKMGLDRAGVRLKDDGSVDVNEKLETSVNGVYAVGDATGGLMFSHRATSMGVIAAENAMGKPGKFPANLVSRVLWTSPQVGAVGLSEAEAEQKGMDIEVGDFPYSINGLAMSWDRMDGAVKIVSDARYGEILGVHIVGANATELIGEAVLAMQLECTASEFARSIRAHPTFSEALVDAARDAAGWALYLPKR